jgi:hypothetical protein
MKKNVLPSVNKSPRPAKKYKKNGESLKVKKNLTKSDLEFLRYYAMTNSKTKSVVAAGLHLKKDGTPYEKTRHYEIANMILRNDKAVEIVKKYQEEILKSNCLTIEKVINETYQFYELLLEEKKYHEANICYSRLTELLKMTTSGMSVNTQIVDNSGGGITVNYITPGQENKKEE